MYESQCILVKFNYKTSIKIICQNEESSRDGGAKSIETRVIVVLVE